MSMIRISSILLPLAVNAFMANAVLAGSEPQGFGVIIHRNPTITAQYWNPILRYASKKSGVPLDLKVSRTGNEHTKQVGSGLLRYLFSNHNFLGHNAAVGYRVLARPEVEGGRGLIVVSAASPIKRIEELNQMEVVFPHSAAFLGYHLPMDALLRRNLDVKPAFAGNQEGAIGQLVAGRARAIGVSADIFHAYVNRTGFAYRELWASAPYLNLALSVHPSVPQSEANAVRDAFTGMNRDPEGKKVLAAASAMVKSKVPLAFIAAVDAEFDNLRRFYEETKVAMTR